MKMHYLTIPYYLKGSFFSLLEKMFQAKSRHQNPRFKNYSLKKWIKTQNEEDLTSVGIFTSPKYGQVIIKLVRYLFPNQIYEQLINEFSILKQLGKEFSKISKKVKVPRVYEFIESKRMIGFSSQYVNGKSLDSYPLNYQKEIIKLCLKTFSQVNQNLSTVLPKRSSLLTLMTFPIYLAIVTVKDFKKASNFLHLGWMFLTHYLSIFRFYPKYVFAHRDLHPANILVKGKSAFLIDPEISCFAEEETDLAILARGFGKELKVGNLIKLLNEMLTTEEKRTRFIALAIYYGIQMMAIRDTKDPDYLEAENFLVDFLPAIMKTNKKPHLELVEVIQKFGLRTVGLFNSGFPFLRRIRRPIILCYHSINDLNWRFSVSVSEFESQMKYLQQNFRVISMADLIKGKIPEKAVVLTFDDGYADNLQTAAKIIRKYKFPATLFIMGDSKNANRQELDNQLPLLSLAQIKKLKSFGWEIGFHTKTHADLRNLNSPQIEEEIVKSKKAIEKKLGFDLRFFAYPRGLYNGQIINAVKKAGFKAAFTVDGDFYNSNDPMFLKDRVSMEKNIDLADFIAMLTPLGILFMVNLMNLLKLKEAIQHQIGTFFQNRQGNKSFQMELQKN